MLTTIFDQMANFDFKSGETTMSSWHAPAAATVAYLLVVSFIKRYVRRVRKQGFDLRWLTFLHNFAMTACTTLLFGLLAMDLTASVLKDGWMETYGDMHRQNVSGFRTFLFYAHYLLQFVQLFDTVLLALRDKPLVFFHIYAHIASLVLAWSQLRAHSSFQWMPILLSLAVQMMMYSYYSLHTIKRSCSWKRFLTFAQIMQITVALLSVIPALGMRTLHDLGFWRFPKCNINYEASFFAIIVMSTYLGLYARFYRDTYTKRQQGGRHLEEKEFAKSGYDVTKPAHQPHQSEDITYTFPSDTVMDLEQRMKQQEDSYMSGGHQRHTSYILRRNSSMMPRSPTGAYDPSKFSL